MTDKIFDQLHHICIVVENMDRAVAFYESIGIGPWRDFPSLEAFRGEFEAPDVDDFMKLHYRFASLGNVQLQLCAPPPGNTLQRKFLDEHGEGVFHLVSPCPTATPPRSRPGRSVWHRSCADASRTATASPISTPTTVVLE